MDKGFYGILERFRMEKTLDLLSKNVKYYENPIDEPCANFEEVVALWNVVADNQKDVEYKYEINLKQK